MAKEKKNIGATLMELNSLSINYIITENLQYEDKLSSLNTHKTLNGELAGTWHFKVLK